MSDPKRWLDRGAGASGLERSLLLAGRRVEPANGDQEKIWTALATQVGPAAGGAAAGAGAVGAGAAGMGAAGAVAAGAGATGTSVAAGLGVAGLLKWVAIGAATAAGVLGTKQLVSPTHYSTTTPASAISTPSAAPAFVVEAKPLQAPVAVVSAPEPSAAAVAIPIAPPAVPEVEPEATASAAPPSLPVASASAAAEPVAREDRSLRLRQESRMMAAVRAALRRGDAAGAMAELDAIQRAFPEGGLAQEREALLIETLARLGRHAEASSRATNFLRLWPSSPFADTVRPHAR